MEEHTRLLPLIYASASVQHIIFALSICNAFRLVDLSRDPHGLGWRARGEHETTIADV